MEREDVRRVRMVNGSEDGLNGPSFSESPKNRIETIINNRVECLYENDSINKNETTAFNDPFQQPAKNIESTTSSQSTKSQTLIKIEPIHDDQMYTEGAKQICDTQQINTSTRRPLEKSSNVNTSEVVLDNIKKEYNENDAVFSAASSAKIDTSRADDEKNERHWASVKNKREHSHGDKFMLGRCPMCLEVLPLGDQLTSHMNIPHELTCFLQCGFLFVHPSALHSHHIETHGAVHLASNAGFSFCHECYKVLEIHEGIRREHTANEHIKCNMCNKTFHTSKMHEFEYHAKRDHPFFFMSSAQMDLAAASTSTNSSNDIRNILRPLSNESGQNLSETSVDPSDTTMDNIADQKNPGQSLNINHNVQTLSEIEQSLPSSPDSSRKVMLIDEDPNKIKIIVSDDAEESTDKSFEEEDSERNVVFVPIPKHGRNCICLECSVPVDSSVCEDTISEYENIVPISNSKATCNLCLVNLPYTDYSIRQHINGWRHKSYEENGRFETDLVDVHKKIKHTRSRTYPESGDRLITEKTSKRIIANESGQSSTFVPNKFFNDSHSSKPKYNLEVTMTNNDIEQHKCAVNNESITDRSEIHNKYKRKENQNINEEIHTESKTKEKSKRKKIIWDLD